MYVCMYVCIYVCGFGYLFKLTAYQAIGFSMLEFDSFVNTDNSFNYIFFIFQI